MNLHICVLHLVDMSATDGLAVVRAAAERLKLTLRIYYRKAVEDEALWEDVLMVCEGKGCSIDAFLCEVDGAWPAFMRGMCMLLRRWSYQLQEVPSERAHWGFEQWRALADHELQAAHEATAETAETVDTAVTVGTTGTA